MWEYNKLPEKPTACQRLKHNFLCPPHGFPAQYLTVIVTCLLTYGVLWALTGKQALPGGGVFALVVLLFSCIVAGALIEKIKLPPLVGK